ncbi:MAG: AEC family transporter [Anaerolineales bacterium]
MILLSVFLNNLLPIFLCAAAGVALGRAFHPDIRSVTRLAFYVFSPCLVFSSLTQSLVNGAEFAQLAIFTLTHILLMAALTAGLGLALRLERRVLVTLIIAAVFVNGGNFGLAANRFAFGEEALARAVVFYIFSTIGVYTVGIFLASLGKRSAAEAIREVVTVPAFYALIAAGLARFTGFGVPLFLERAVTLLSEAAIPVMLVLLGLQIAQMKREVWARAKAGTLALAVGLQLIVAPLLAIALAAVLGLGGVTRQAAILEASMPTAVITTVLALQYELDIDLMTAVVIVSTILSPLTLTPLIVYLQTGG